jgi:hypothetical protein
MATPGNVTVQDLGRAFGIRFPTDEEEDLLRRFTVNLNHLDHIRLCANDPRSC